MTPAFDSGHSGTRAKTTTSPARRLRRLPDARGLIAVPGCFDGLSAKVLADARAALGFDEALARCHEFAAEGVDIIYLDAPDGESEMRRLCAELPCPGMANIMFGSDAPLLPMALLEDIGFRLVTYPHLLLASGLAAMRRAAAAFTLGHQPEWPSDVPLLPFGELKQSLGFDRYLAQAARYRTPNGPQKPARKDRA